MHDKLKPGCLRKADFLVFGSLLTLLFYFFAPAIAQAIMIQEDTSGIYRDKNDFFSCQVPQEWIKQEASQDTVSEVRFTSPDGKAGLAIFAQLDDRELNQLFFDKKAYIKNYQQFFPQGEFSLDWDTLGERAVVRIILDLPSKVKQEQYFFYDQGVRFDLIYGVANREDFNKYRPRALDIFQTVRRQAPNKNK